MRIILVVDKKANKFLQNPWNIGAADEQTVITGNIVDGINGSGRFIWNGERWVNEFPRVVIHNRQVTKDSEIQPIVTELRFCGYETAIIGCDPGNTAVLLTNKLRELFGSENVTEIYPYLDRGFEQYRSLTNRIRSLLDLATVGKVGVGTEGADGAVNGRALSLKITLADTENVINIIFDEGTHLELDFRSGTVETA